MLLFIVTYDITIYSNNVVKEAATILDVFFNVKLIHLGSDV